MNSSEAEMDEILKCGICLSEFRDPRQLTCGHVFCFKCIETDYKIRDRNNGKCPICQTEYWPSPNRAIDSLPQCPLPLRHILSLRERRGQCCEDINCLGNPAKFICIRCHVWLCIDCKSKTCKKQGLLLDTHEAFQQHELESSLFDIVIRSRHKSCREHPKQDVQWYCHHCKMLACYLCKMNFHVGHAPLVTLEARSRECHDDLEMIIKSLKKKQKEHMDNKTILTELVSSRCKEFVNVQHCYTSLDHCNIGVDECENLILLITKLLENGSMKVIVEMSANLEERITTELGKCLLLETVREVIWTKPVETEQEVATIRTGDEKACENDDSSIGLWDDTCESSLCVNKDSAHWMCLHCRKWLCSSCMMVSCERGGNSDTKHRALKAFDIDTALYDIVMRSRCSSCPVHHPNNDIDSYCSQCNVLCCELCCYRHAHHKVVTIAERSMSCRVSIEEKKKRLGNLISEYSETKDRVSKIKSNRHFHILNSAYFEGISSECVLRTNKCDNLSKVLHFLLSYASDRVLVETFDKVENEIEAELQKKPSDNLLEVQKMLYFACETLSDKVHK